MHRHNETTISVSRVLCVIIHGLTRWKVNYIGKQVYVDQMKNTVLSQLKHNGSTCTAKANGQAHESVLQAGEAELNLCSSVEYRVSLSMRIDTEFEFKR